MGFALYHFIKFILFFHIPIKKNMQIQNNVNYKMQRNFVETHLYSDTEVFWNLNCLGTLSSYTTFL